MPTCGARTFDQNNRELTCIREFGHCANHLSVTHVDGDGWMWTDPYKPVLLSDDEEPF